MDKSAFQLCKYSPRSNNNARLHDTPIITYGRVIKVIDVQTVGVETIVQTSLSKEVYTVTLLNLSSALLEISDYPKIGDTVLLLFLQRYDLRMFAQDTVNNANAAGYNKFSGVGILLSTAKSVASTLFSCYEDNGKPVAELTSASEVYGTFTNLAAITFCRAVFDSEDETLITVLFGKGRPLVEKHLARIEREHGFWADLEKAWEEMDASVTERYSLYAPILKDIQGAQTTAVGLGKDQDGDEGKPVETDAPITETVHGKAPITRDIRSPQTITVGIGNAETEDTEEERDAPIHETYGSKAPITKDIRGPQAYKIGTGPDGPTDASVTIELDEKAAITLTSKSGITLHFDKAVSIDSSEGFDLSFTGAVTISSKDALSLLASGDIAIGSDGNLSLKANQTGTLEIGNRIATLGAMISDLLQALISFKSVGSPASHTAPDLTAAATQLKAQWDQVFT
jgi:hypothetical protein